MRYLINKYKKILIVYSFIYVFIVLICVIRIDNSITAIGDIVPIDNTINVEDGYESEGSFNSIYVISIDRPTIFQSFVASLSNKIDLSDLYDGYVHLSNSELSLMGTIQKNQSIEASVITAYEAASLTDDSISIDYEFEGFIVCYYTATSSDFEIGDIIYKINDVTTNDDLANSYNNLKVGDMVYVLRDDKEVVIEIQENHLYSLGLYYKYDVNYSQASPVINIETSTSSGSSAGLLQTLNIYNQLTSTDYTYSKTIAGTGTISVGGSVGAIGGETFKVRAAIEANADVMFIPSANYESAKTEYDKYSTSMKLVEVSTFDDALNYLKEAYGG